MTHNILKIFDNSIFLKDISVGKKGIDTSKNDRFLRLWFESSRNNLELSCSSRHDAKILNKKWFPLNKGGSYKKWYGNQEWVINWANDGQELFSFPKAYIRNPDFYFQPSISWTGISSTSFVGRFYPKGFIFDSTGPSLFFESDKASFIIIAIINSKLSKIILADFAPTLHFEIGQVLNMPIPKQWRNDYENISGFVYDAIHLSQQDWDNFETSWDFQTHPLLRHNTKHLSEAFTIWQNKSETAFRELQRLEEENNRYWIEAYCLQDELTPEVPDDQITIRRADLNKDIRSLISYAVGCIMGRYSLDKPGLIHAGQPFDSTLHQTLSASSDAIIPITDQAYFDNDIVTRFIEFLRVAYSPETLTENLNFIANALTLKNGESAQERIRRYFLQEFISDHIQTYKKRPIYWLFTSGKKRAFGALLYLHRYSEDALARIRTDYVLELQVKLDGEIARAQQQLDNTSSSAAKKAATSRLKELQAQQLELRDYQAKLQTQADARINLDLDDGVAYNYTRFKGLVYEGTDLKIADLEKASQWKLELLKQVHSEV